MKFAKNTIAQVVPARETKSLACVPRFEGFTPHLSEQTIQLGNCNFSLKSVLHNGNAKDPMSRHQFEEFLRGELAEEHLEFWCDTSYVLEQDPTRDSDGNTTEPSTEKLKSMDPQGDAMDFLKERYIKPQSEKEINIDHGTREGILEAQPGEALPKRLEAAVREVESPLFDSFQRYLKIASSVNLTADTAHQRKYFGIAALLLVGVLTVVFIVLETQNMGSRFLRSIPVLLTFFGVEKLVESHTRL